MTDHPSPVFSFLSQQGAKLAADGRVLGFGNEADETASTDFIAPLTDEGVIALTGDDAEAFLQGQCTNDARHPDTGHAQLNGYCTPKGRLLASFVHWREGQTHYLALPHDLQPAIQKRLSMYVLRAKVKLTDASGDRILLGIGAQNPAHIQTLFEGSIPSDAWSRAETPYGALIAVPGTSRSHCRWIWVADLAQLEALWPKLSKQLRPVSTERWRASDIEAGIPRITPPTQELFVPQAINFELVGGVNFKKGCYPGQEVVARSQYLGKLKRRAAIGKLEGATEVAAGSDVFHSNSADPVGRVVNAARAHAGSTLVLIECPVADTLSGQLHWGRADGPQILLEQLPYPLASEAA